MQNKSKQLDFTGQNIYIGLDTHLRNWKATVMVENTFYKTFSQDPVPKNLSNYLKKNFPEANYFSAYELTVFLCIVYQLYCPIFLMLMPVL